MAGRWFVVSAAAAALLGGVGAPRHARCDGPGVAPQAVHASTFERGRRDLMKVALTFDGGSDAGFTAEILEILRDKAVPATFFLTGPYIVLNPGLALAIHLDGHEVGNHTWSHSHLTTWSRNRRHDTLPGVDRGFLERELGRTAQAWRDLTGLELAPLWRAPYGEVNPEILAWAARSGLFHVGWTRADRGRQTLDSLDWVGDPSSRNYLSSQQIASRLLAFGDGGDGLKGGVVLMHLSTRREDPSVRRLPGLIDALRGRGYRLVTVTELIEDAAAPLTRTASLGGRDDPR